MLPTKTTLRYKLSAVVIAWLMLALFFSLPAYSTLHGADHGGQNPLPPEEAFVPSLIHKDNGDYAVNWHIAPGYYLYQDKIKLSSDHHPLSYQLPPADEVIEDQFFGQSNIYRQQLTVHFSAADHTQIWPITVHYQGCWDGGLCYPPQTHMLHRDHNLGAGAAAINESLLGNEYVQYLQQYSLATAMLIFLGLGMLLAFTPCVLPMVPILSGIIAGGNRVSRSVGRSLLLSSAYVLTMAAIYSVLGVLAGVSGTNLYAWFQKPAVLLPFAFIFVLLAAAMFGWLHLRLPSHWHNRLHIHSSAIKQGNVGGAILLGGLSAVIVSPCITPALVGTLLFIAQSGSATIGASILFALALGMGLPLILFGTALGRFLPKPGPAMLIVNTLFGFLLLATAVWLLDRVVPSVWSMILATLLLIFIAARIHQQTNLLGHNSKLAVRCGAVIPVMMLSILFASSVSTGGRQLIAPWAHWLHQDTQLPLQQFSFTKVTTTKALNHALGSSRAAAKPAMVYFSAKWCTTCKELDAYVFNQQQVQLALRPYDLIKVDVTAGGVEEGALLKRFNLFGPPSILFFNRQGQEIESQRAYGYMDKNQFIAHLKKLDELHQRQHENQQSII